MYRIKASDQQEYGPVPADRIRGWITDRRASARTPCAGDDGVWRTLADFPEFAEALAQVPPAPPATAPSGPAARPGTVSLTRAEAARRLRVPAALIMVVSLLQATLALAGLLWRGALADFITRQAPNLPVAQQDALNAWRQRPASTRDHVAVAVLVGLSATAFGGAAQMLRLRSPRWAMSSAIIVLLPCSTCCVAGVPLGVWAALTLNRPNIREHFT